MFNGKFSDLKNAIANSKIEKKQQEELLSSVQYLENSAKNGGFLEKYNEFIQIAAPHMTIIAPFIPFLASLI